MLVNRHNSNHHAILCMQLYVQLTGQNLIADLSPHDSTAGRHAPTHEREHKHEIQVFDIK